MEHRARRTRIACALRERRIDAFLITHMPNVYYLSRFSGSTGVLGAFGDKWILFTDGRYREQAREEVTGARVVISKGSALAAAASWLGESGARNVAVEADNMSVATYSALAKQLPRDVRIRKTTGLIEKLRLIKDETEIRCIREAVELGSQLLRCAVECVRPDATEASIAAEIEYRAREWGAEGMSFDTIIAGGTRSALPHARASRAVIPRKGFVVMDFGVILAHYCSDMTRTVHVGRPSLADRDMYSAVLEAQLAAIAAVRPGVEIGRVDEAARSVLKSAGLAKYFTHSTGHGVGLEIHEAPRIAAGVTALLQPGMVITIEPGVYVPRHGGVRIEDMVLVTEDGCEVLTNAEKQMISV